MPTLIDCLILKYGIEDGGLRIERFWLLPFLNPDTSMLSPEVKGSVAQLVRALC